MILRIIYPDIGRIDVLGNGDASAANDRVGYLPEERGLYKKLTVRTNANLLRLPKRHVVPRRDAADRLMVGTI